MTEYRFSYIYGDVKYAEQRFEATHLALPAMRLQVAPPPAAQARHVRSVPDSVLEPAARQAREEEEDMSEHESEKTFKVPGDCYWTPGAALADKFSYPGGAPLVLTPEAARGYRELWKKWRETCSVRSYSVPPAVGPWNARDADRYFRAQAAESYWNLINYFEDAYGISDWRIRRDVLAGRFRYTTRKRREAAKRSAQTRSETNAGIRRFEVIQGGRK